MGCGYGSGLMVQALRGGARKEGGRHLAWRREGGVEVGGAGSHGVKGRGPDERVSEAEQKHRLQGWINLGSDAGARRRDVPAKAAR